MWTFSVLAIYEQYSHAPCWLLTYKLQAVLTIFIFISANSFFNLLRIREAKVFFTKFRRHHGKFYKKTDEEPCFTLSTKAYPYDCSDFFNIIFSLFLLTLNNNAQISYYVVFNRVHILAALHLNVLDFLYFHLTNIIRECSILILITLDGISYKTIYTKVRIRCEIFVWYPIPTIFANSFLGIILISLFKFLFPKWERVSAL